MRSFCSLVDILGETKPPPVECQGERNTGHGLRVKLSCTPSTRPKLAPENVTAFRKDMVVHCRYGQPCPRCGKNSPYSLRGQRERTRLCPNRLRPLRR